MPLTAGEKPLFDNSDRSSITFPMYDGGKIVRVIVPGRILRRLARPNGDQKLPIDALFEKYRAPVEEAASRKYDTGRLVGGKVKVVRADVWPGDPGVVGRFLSLFRRS